MSEEQITELESLKSLAREMGVDFHPSIGLDKLKQKIADADAASREEDEPEEPKATKSPAQIKAEALKLVRIRMACMNPAKREYVGEIFQAGNKLTGTVKKYVPYDVEWHVPQIILNQIQQSKCQIFVAKKVRTDSGIVVNTKEGKLIRQYAVEILPPLTDEERKALAQRQAMARGTAEAA